jgi:hypothetical protein
MWYRCQLRSHDLSNDVFFSCFKAIFEYLSKKSIFIFLLDCPSSVMSVVTVLFDSIQKDWSSIENWSGSSTNEQQFQTLVTTCIAHVKEAQRLVESASLISANDELEDISTKSLRYE